MNIQTDEIKKHIIENAIVSEEIIIADKESLGKIELYKTDVKKNKYVSISVGLLNDKENAKDSLEKEKTIEVVIKMEHAMKYPVIFQISLKLKKLNLMKISTRH